MRIIEDVKLDFGDVIIQPKRSSLVSRKDVVLERTYKFKYSGRELTCIGIIASNMDGVGTFEMALELSKQKILTALHKHYSVDELVKFYNTNKDITQFVFYSTGVSSSDQEKLKAFVEKFGSAPENICIDVANGYTETFVQFVREMRTTYPTSILLVGNVVTSDMAEELTLAGVDIVKVGIGSGQMCTTRIVAGVGYPQLSAIIETSDAVHGLNGYTCSDGGCTTPADVAKAFAAGADFVMLGSMLAGHDEGGGEVKGATANFIGYTMATVDKNNYNKIIVYYGRVGDKAFEYAVPIKDAWILEKINEHRTELSASDPTVKKYPNLFKITLPENPVILFYGMSSSTAMDKHNGGVAEYRSSEGRTVELPYRGAVKDTINYILGGIRSACTYTGSRKLKELSKRTTFVRVNNTHSRIYENVTTKIR